MEIVDIVLISEYIQSSGSFALLLLFALIVVQCHIPIMPFGIVASTCGFIYGFRAGIIISWLSVVIGSIIALYLYRRLKLNKLAGKILKGRKPMPEEFIFGFIIIAHNVPVIPIAVPNILASMSRIKTSRFIIATAIGLFIPSVGYVAIGSGVESFLLKPNYLTLVMIILLLLIFYLLRRYSKDILQLVNKGPFRHPGK